MTARAKRTTTNPTSAIPIRRMILLAVVLLTTLRLIPNEVLCLCRRLIHPSAWKEYSPKFAFREFWEVRSVGAPRITVLLPVRWIYQGPEVRYCTLGRAPAPATSADGRRRALRAIQPPPIAISNPPTGCVSRLLPVV